MKTAHLLLYLEQWLKIINNSVAVEFWLFSDFSKRHDCIVFAEGASFKGYLPRRWRRGKGSSLRREIYENEATNMKAYKDRNLKVKNEDDIFLFKGGIQCCQLLKI